MHFKLNISSTPRRSLGTKKWHYRGTCIGIFDSFDILGLHFLKRQKTTVDTLKSPDFCAGFNPLKNSIITSVFLYPKAAVFYHAKLTTYRRSLS